MIPSIFGANDSWHTMSGPCTSVQRLTSMKMCLIDCAKCLTCVDSLSSLIHKVSFSV